MPISFDWEMWDIDKEILMHEPGSDLGFSAIQAGLNPGYAPNRKIANRDSSIGPMIDGVIGLLAGSMDWLRSYGLSAEEVQSRVR